MKIFKSQTGTLFTFLVIQNFQVFNFSTELEKSFSVKSYRVETVTPVYHTSVFSLWERS